MLDILQSPSEHVELYEYLCALKSAGKRAQSFLFHHYLLTLGVLGTHSLGSLGYEIRELAERAVQPLFPEINQAHHDYVMLTNFEHGDSSGLLVYNNELEYGHDPYRIASTAEHPGRCAGCPLALVEAQVREYFRAIEGRDVEAWVDLFDPIYGQLHDVPATRPYLGKRRLRVFINGMFRAFSEMHAVCSAPRIDGNLASIDWRFDAVSYHGVATILEGREEFVFDDEGQILKAVAHWRPEAVAEQWRREADARLARASRSHSYVASLGAEPQSITGTPSAGCARG